MAKSFQERLRAALEGAGMTVSDAARWFDRPFTTVHLWVNENRRPSGQLDARKANDDLLLLEHGVKHLREFFPVSALLTQKNRAAHLKEARDAAERHRRVPEKRTA